MTIKEYLKKQITLTKQPDLSLIYQELMNMGHSPREIYQTVNEVLAENMVQALDEYNKKKNEKK
jgi:hypothetical protein